MAFPPGVGKELPTRKRLPGRGLRLGRSAGQGMSAYMVSSQGLTDLAIRNRVWHARCYLQGSATSLTPAGAM